MTSLQSRFNPRDFSPSRPSLQPNFNESDSVVALSPLSSIISSMSHNLTPQLTEAQDLFHKAVGPLRLPNVGMTANIDLEAGDP